MPDENAKLLKTMPSLVFLFRTATITSIGMLLTYSLS